MGYLKKADVGVGLASNIRKAIGLLLFAAIFAAAWAGLRALVPEARDEPLLAMLGALFAVSVADFIAAPLFDRLLRDPEDGPPPTFDERAWELLRTVAGCTVIYLFLHYGRPWLETKSGMSEEIATGVVMFLLASGGALVAGMWSTEAHGAGYRDRD